MTFALGLENEQRVGGWETELEEPSRQEELRRGLGEQRRSERDVQGEAGQQ